MEWYNILSVGFSIIAVCLSSWVFYHDYWKPFNLNVRASGRVTIAKNPYSKGLKQDCLLIDLIFSNSGAKRGVVENIAICIRDDEDKKVILRNLAVVKDRTLNLTKELPPPQMETFLSFNLEKHDNFGKKILFVPIETESMFSFREQTYHADVWILSGRNRSWEKHESFGFTVTKEDVGALAKTQLTQLEDGGYFIRWLNQDKPIDSQEEQLSRLKKIIEK